jgi:hypothetical protein
MGNSNTTQAYGTPEPRCNYAKKLTKNPRRNMRKCLLLLLLLSLYSNTITTTSAFAQVPTIYLPVPKAERIADSLKTLPKVRKEAEKWQHSAWHFQSARDSALWAQKQTQQGLTNQERAFLMQTEALKNETIKVDWWKKVARRRGFLNYVFAAIAAGVTYFAVTR